MKTAHDLRCMCSHHTKLALWGLTDDGQAYVHVLVYKQREQFGNIVVTSGRVELRCRHCQRWMNVTVEPKPSVSFSDDPPEVLAATVQ